MTEPPSRYVQPDLSDARVNRVWGHVSEQLALRRPRSWRWLALGVALSGAAAGAWLVSTRLQSPAAAVQAGLSADARLETAAEPLSVALRDGSKVALLPHSELKVRGNQPTRVALSLGRGRADFDVVPQRDRSFSVVAGDVEVRVLGTRFSVAATPNPDGLRVEVSVLHGVVEVLSARRPGIVARVAAGQSWIQVPERAQAAVTAMPPVATASTEPPAPATEPSVAAATEPSEKTHGGSGASSAIVTEPSARELFEKAGERRRAGDAAAAARAYEQLLRLHPGDGRASLSAFELGRLRMDRLGDSAGAISALERAVALNVGPTFREDALARLVSVYATQGNFTACARARDRYLASYPSGVHAGAVSARCGAR